MDNDKETNYKEDIDPNPYDYSMSEVCEYENDDLEGELVKDAIDSQRMSNSFGYIKKIVFLRRDLLDYLSTNEKFQESRENFIKTLEKKGISFNEIDGIKK